MCLHDNDVLMGRINLYIYKYLQYRYLVFNPPGLGTHCGLVWSELCTQAWYPGLGGQRPDIDTVFRLLLSGGEARRRSVQCGSVGNRCVS